MTKNRKVRRADLAYKSEFMESRQARPLRILAEYLDPLTRLKKAGVADTIVIFGSARILSPDEARAQLTAVRRRIRGKLTKEHRQRLHFAQRAVEMSRFYEDARQLARRITEWSMKLENGERRFVICSGGGPGIMEAANRGASDGGGLSIGLNIQLPHEQVPNPYITPDLNFEFHYFFMRKLWFAQLAKALIVFPGGFGTMDELWEMLTLAQTGKLSKRNLILIYGRRYWDEVLNWKAMVRWGTISEDDLGLLQFADTVDEAFDRVRRTMERYHIKPANDWDGN